MLLQHPSTIPDLPRGTARRMASGMTRTRTPSSSSRARRSARRCDADPGPPSGSSATTLLRHPSTIPDLPRGTARRMASGMTGTRTPSSSSRARRSAKRCVADPGPPSGSSALTRLRQPLDDPGSATRHFAPHGVRDDGDAHPFFVIPGAPQRGAVRRRPGTVVRIKRPDAAATPLDDPGSATRHFAPHGVRDDGEPHPFFVIPGAPQREAVRRRPGTVVRIKRTDATATPHDDPGSATRHCAPHGVRDDEGSRRQRRRRGLRHRVKERSSVGERRKLCLG
jgi:hypothetical protein